MGTTSLSLLGGLQSPRSEPRDATSVSILASNVSVHIIIVTIAFALINICHMHYACN